MSDLEDVVAGLRSQHRQRNFAMETQKRSMLSLGAYLRLQLGWRRPVEGKDAERLGMDKAAIARLINVNKQAVTDAAAIIEAAESFCAMEARELTRLERSEAKRKPYEPRPIVYPTVHAFDHLGAVAIASVKAWQPMTDIRSKSEKTMTGLARQLPVWAEFGEPITGFGEISFAVIVAEAGNLSMYSNPGKLWKRMGLAPHVGNDGKDHLPSSFRAGDLTAAEWVRLGYSRARRSRMYMVADSLLKQQSEYRDLYLERKAYEHRKAEGAGLIPATEAKATVDGWAENGLPPLALVKKIDPSVHASAGHLNAKARVYVEKRLLKNLWRTWRRLEGLPYEEPVEIRDAA